MIAGNDTDINVSSFFSSAFSYNYNNNLHNETYEDFGVSLLVDDTLEIGSDNGTILNPASTETAFCNSTGWIEFNKFYRTWHGETTVLICIFGCIANLLNLIVLTRKGMISPTNGILTGLALADLFTMIEYIPYSFSMYIWKRQYTYGWAHYVLFHANFSQVCHTVSIWLTLTLAIWRYIAVGIPTKSIGLCTMNRAKWAIASAYFVSPLLCIPVFLSFSIGSMPMRNSTELQYFADWSKLAQANGRLLAKTNFWIYSVVIKIIPCIVLTVVSFRLINALMEAKRRKEKLLSKRPPRPVIGTTNSSGTTLQGHLSGGGINKTSSKAGHHHEHSNETADRTTKMLLAVLLLFLITEFPQGILGLLSGILGEPFFRTCYMYLGDVMDLLALLNSAINFILYCVMSKKFRETFSEVFYLDLIRSKIFGTTTPTPGGSILPKHSTNTTMSTVLVDNNDMVLKCSNGTSPVPLRTKTNASGTYISVDTGTSSITAL